MKEEQREADESAIDDIILFSQRANGDFVRIMDKIRYGHNFGWSFKVNLTIDMKINGLC